MPEYSQDFDSAYNLWPKRSHKFEAWAEWQVQVKRAPLVVPEILAALEWQAALYARREVKMIPDFRRWLHGRMWEDEAVDGRRKPVPRVGCSQCPHPLHLPEPCAYCQAIARQNKKPFGCSQ